MRGQFIAAIALGFGTLLAACGGNDSGSDAPPDASADDAPVLYNPCCRFAKTENCDEAAFTAGSNKPAQSPSSPDLEPTGGVGAYSPQCSKYLERVWTAKSWMPDAVVKLATNLAKIEGWPPATGVDDKNDTVKEVFEQIGALSSNWDTSKAKSLGAGVSSGRYAGVYNCESQWEQNHTCKAANDEYEDGVVGEGHLVSYFVGYVPNGNPSASTACPKVADHSSECAFDIWLLDKRTGPFSSGWHLRPSRLGPNPLNTGVPGFQTLTRPWYELGIGLHAAATAAYLPVYKNFSTGEPISGYVAKFTNGEGVALALQYLIDTPAYIKLDKAHIAPCQPLDATSDEFAEICAEGAFNADDCTALGAGVDAPGIGPFCWWSKPSGG